MKRSSARRRIALIATVVSLLSARVSFGQLGPDSLALSSGTAGSNGGIALNLSLTSPAGSEPTAVQWTLTYPPANVVSISVNSGAAITAAGKSLNCFGGGGTFSCVASAMNSAIISNGVVGVVNLTMAAGLTNTSIGISSSGASSPAGEGIVLFTTGGIVTGGSVLPTVASLSCLPATLQSSSSSTCTVKLTGAAPTAGAAVALTSTNAALSVPASVTIAAGATSATFSATTAAIGSNQSATLTAAYNSSSANATISLSASVLVSSLVCNSISLGPLSSSTCTITLTQAAPTGGAAVTLTNTNATLTVPASVTVQAGATSATFTIVTAAIGSNQSATITAAYNSSSANVTIGLASSVTVSSLACNPGTLGQSAVSVCTVTLASAAPAGGTSVTLASNNSALTAPSSLTVATGAISATFSATAAANIASNQNAILTASVGNSSQTATISLVASVPAVTGAQGPITFVQSISASPSSPSSGVSGAGQTLSQAFPGSVTAGDLIIVGVFVDPGATVSVTDTLGGSYTQVSYLTVAGDHDADVFVAAASASGADTITVNAGSGKNVYGFSLHEYTGATTAVDASTTAQGNSMAPASGSLTTITPNDLVFAWFTNGNNFYGENFTALNAAYTKREMSGGGDLQCGFSNCVESGDLVAVTPMTTNSTATLSVADIWSATVIAFKGGGSTSLVCNPTSLGPNSSSTCTVALTQAAPAGGATVTLTTTNALLSVPASVTLTAGATSATFNATTAAIGSNQSATITATYNNSSANTTISMVASALVSSLACNPASVGPNSSTTCTVTLTQPAPAGGAAVTLTNTNATMSVPPTVIVAAAATSATFSAITAAIGSNQSATITAAYNSSSANTTISMVASVLVSSLVCNPTSLGPNSSSTCTVTLTQAAPTGGAAVTLTNTNATLTVPATVTVAAAATSATFRATTASIGSNQSATLTAAYNSSSANATISLSASVLVSSLVCNPTSLGPNSSSTCTVTLTQAAPTGGAAVTLTNTNATLTVPAAVTVVGAATSATFGATTAAIGSNQSATITAAYNSSSANVTISLAAPVLVSSLVCNPTSLGPNSSSTCTVTLTQAAPTGGAAVTLTNTNATLTVPAAVTIAAAATSATFSATTAAIGSNQSATLNASVGNSSQTATFSLVASVLPVTFVQSISASPYIIAGQTLSQVFSGSVTVGDLIIVGVFVDPGATVSVTDTFGDSFSQVTHQSVANDHDADVLVATASASGVDIITVDAGSGKNVYAFSMHEYTGATTVVDASITAQGNNTAPASGSLTTVTPNDLVFAWFTSGNNFSGENFASLNAAYTKREMSGSGVHQCGFSNCVESGDLVATSTLTTNATATLNVSDIWSATVIAFKSGGPTSLLCNPTTFGPDSSSTCTVALTQPAPRGGGTVTLTNTNSTLTVPASFTVPAGATSAAVSATTAAIGSSQSATLTAALGTSSQTGGFTLNPTPVLSSFACVPTSVPTGSSSACTVSMSNAAGNVVVNLSSNNAGLAVPATVTVPQGSSSAGFSATALSSASGRIVVSAVFNGTTKAELFQITAGSTSSNVQPQVNQISCTPKSLIAGSRGTCRVTLGHVENSAAAEVLLSSSSAALRLPEKLVTSPGQSTVEFQVDAVSSAEGVVVSANLGSAQVKETLAVVPDRSTPIQVPGARFVKYGTEVRFRVSPLDPAASISSGALPAGAHFDSTAGELRWTPDRTQLGVHQINFTAIDSAGGKSNASVTVQVDSGEPMVTDIVNAASRSREAACSPGAIATIEGRWLTDGTAVTDAIGSSMELAGTKVWANGATVPILAASATAINILCPNSLPGSEIQLVVETDHGTARPLSTTARSTAPGIFSLDGSGTGQGWVARESIGTNSVAMVRNYRIPAQPAVAGERLLIYATGIGQLTNISVQIGGSKVPAEATKPVPNYLGLYQVVISVPNILIQQDDLPLSLSGDGPEGTVRTNVVNIAVETNSK
jgi:hypothetical protein